MERICPTHNKELVSKKTQYGIRYSCPVGLCSVVVWNGSTSTPADYETRQARIAAHDSFDKLWKSGMFKRSEAYKQLSQHLGLSKKETHIGYFDIETCSEVIYFVSAIIC